MGASSSSSAHSSHASNSDSIRHEANVEAEKRNKCYADSQAAWKSGDRAGAKHLSDQGKLHDKRMRQLNAEAASNAFSERNNGRPEDEVDLHGLHVTEATKQAEQAIVACKAKGLKHVTFIVGKGLHSQDGIPKLKPAIEALMDKHNLRCTPNRPNAGCLYVEFVKPEEKGWLGDFLGKCVIC